MASLTGPSENSAYTVTRRMQSSVRGMSSLSASAQHQWSTAVADDSGNTGECGDSQSIAERAHHGGVILIRVRRNDEQQDLR